MVYLSIDLYILQKDTLSASIAGKTLNYMKNIKLTGNTRLSPRKKNFFSTKIILVFQVEYAGYIDMFDNYIYQQKVQGWRDATVEDITDSHLILVN